MDAIRGLLGFNSPGRPILNPEERIEIIKIMLANGVTIDEFITALGIKVFITPTNAEELIALIQETVPALNIQDFYTQETELYPHNQEYPDSSETDESEEDPSSVLWMPHGYHLEILSGEDNNFFSLASRQLSGPTPLHPDFLSTLGITEESLLQLLTADIENPHLIALADYLSANIYVYDYLSEHPVIIRPSESILNPHNIRLTIMEGQYYSIESNTEHRDSDTDLSYDGYSSFIHLLNQYFLDKTADGLSSIFTAYIAVNNIDLSSINGISFENYSGELGQHLANAFNLELHIYENPTSSPIIIQPSIATAEATISFHIVAGYFIPVTEEQETDYIGLAAIAALLYAAHGVSEF